MRLLVTFLRETLESFKKYSSQYQMERKFLVLLVTGSILSVLATYVTLTHSPPFLKDKNLLILLLSLDFGLLLILAAVVAKNIITLWVERKTDQAGAKLHARIVAIFSLVTIIPTILVAGFSAIFFNNFCSELV